MSYENFLTSVYFGSLNKEVFNNFRDLQADDRTQKIIDKYLEVSRQYPAHYLEKKGVLPNELLRKLGEIEFFGLNISKAYGGAGLSLRQYLKVIEETAPQSMALGFTALAHLSIGTKGIVLFGSEEQKRKYLVPAATGEMIFAYALTEPKIGSDSQNIETTAVLSENNRFYILNGNKTYITNANYAGAMTVFAQMDPTRPGFMGAFIVETSWDGVKIGKDVSKMGLKASSTAAVKFKNVRVPKENLLGQPGVRNLRKHILNKYPGKISQMVFLLKEIFRGTIWNIRFSNKEMNRAA
ncbi:MAG: acyl-CoA dehydrogenase family protein, partial [Deltaproteobacteria bacterium]|nr:acyl-CoA dehydrogenase family protein [Deltaproteobacteria bacterium]